MPKPIGPLRRASQRLQLALTAREKAEILAGRRDTAGMTLPHFLCIGAQKGGTSWLWENLRCHPQFFLPDQKELHFFDRRYHRPLRSYASKFADAGDRIRGEITPAYSSLEAERVAFIRAAMPHLRVVVLLRDPVERAWSHAKMHLLEKVAVRRIEEVSEAEFLEHFRGEDSRGKGDYRAILERWEGAFGPDRVFIGFFEDVQARPVPLLQQIVTFLGGSTEVEWEAFPAFQVVNQGRSSPIPPHFRAELQRLYAPQLAWLRERFGERVAGWGE